MYETCYWYILTFHCGIDAVLNGLQTIQAVDGCLSVNLNAGGVSSNIQRIFLWLLASNDCSFGATCRLFEVFILANLSVVQILVLTIGFVLFL